MTTPASHDNQKELIKDLEHLEEISMHDTNLFLHVARVADLARGGYYHMKSTPHSNHKSAEKVPSIFVCPCPPNKNGFCTIPSECIAKRTIEQEDCNNVCRAMQELRQQEKKEREQG